LTLIPRILPIAQGTIVDIPHTAKRLIQVFLLIRSRVEAVAIGAVGHLQILSYAVNAVNAVNRQPNARKKKPNFVRPAIPPRHEGRSLSRKI